MTRLDRKTSVVWAAGTQGTPTGEKTYRTHNNSKNPEQAVTLPNASYVGKFQPSPTRPGGRFGAYSFSREIRGSSVSSVPPADGALLRSCGFKETASGLALHYELGDQHLWETGPSSAGILDPVDIKVYQDGLFHVLNNAVGTVTVNFIAGEIPTFDYVFRGQVDDSKKGGIEASPATDALASEVNPKPCFNHGLTVTLTRTGTVTGTVDGTSSTTVCIDSTATFITDGVLFGDAMALDLGGETATVVSVDSEIQITTTALSSTGTYDNGEDYTITKAASYSTTSLIVPRISYAVNNLIDPRSDLSGESGFAQPILGGRNPQIAMAVEIPAFERMNFEREFIEATTLDITGTHQSGDGIGLELVYLFSAKIVAMPEPVEVNGKLNYSILMEQGVETADDAFALEWKGA